MIKLKHVFVLLILVVLQACGTQKSTTDTASETSETEKSDSLSVSKSKTAEEAGITINSQAKKKSLVTPEKKKK